MFLTFSSTAGFHFPSKTPVKKWHEHGKCLHLKSSCSTTLKGLTSPLSSTPHHPLAFLPCVLIIFPLCRPPVFTCLCTAHSFPCLPIYNNLFSYIISISIVSRQRHSSGGWSLTSHSRGWCSLSEQSLGCYWDVL